MADTSIKVRKDGPYIVRGPITLLDANDQPMKVPEGSAVALCRCGHSATKPFCDGAHRTAEFKSEVVADS
ncbi:MAG: CDGSH iron-sulfur domain-containing protein [Dehalococcoidia bacterium]|nr:CDGSH iron-sulfur domain-containing protein [Dehalococcoidia bacterium]